MFLILTVTELKQHVSNPSVCCTVLMGFEIKQLQFYSDYRGMNIWCGEFL